MISKETYATKSFMYLSEKIRDHFFLEIVLGFPEHWTQSRLYQMLEKAKSAILKNDFFVTKRLGFPVSFMAH